MVLTKLRHADPHQRLGYQFGVDITRVSKIFNHWMTIMYVELQPLIRWPERDMLRKTLPACFKSQYSRATCIIDCSKIFIQQPTSLTARSQTYSNYKSHNTVKSDDASMQITEDTTMQNTDDTTMQITDATA